MTETDPEYWFLPKPAYTEGNAAVALVDGFDYMKHLYDRMQEMQAGDSVFFTLWRGTPEQRLRPDLPSSDTRLLSVFRDLIRRRIVVRVLGWYVPFTRVAWPFVAHQAENKRLVEKLRDDITNQGLTGSAYLDQRLPLVIASHHQKSIVLTAKRVPWAYVGGIDISVDRWDTAEHSSPPERQKELLSAWHDVQCVIQGPGVADIAENFRERWNERKPPVRSSPGDLPTPISAALPVPRASTGTVNVQRLRTLACGGLYDFEPAGEQTSRQGINQAIDRAKHYIYLEDQYFWPCTTVDHLVQAVRRGVYVFLVLAKQYENEGILSTAHYQMRRTGLDVLRRGGADRVICCHLEQSKVTTQIYVHSKLVIVDDRFATIGSTNVGRRSHTTDSELNLSFVDSALVPGTMGGTPVQVCKFAKELRLQLWNEHLNIPITELEDPIAARLKWPVQKRGSAKVHHAVYHSGDAPVIPITLADWYRFIQILRELARQPKPWPNVTSQELELLDAAETLFDGLGVQLMQSDVTDLALGPIWWAPYGLKYQFFEFVKNRIMNVETRCA